MKQTIQDNKAKHGASCKEEDIFPLRSFRFLLPPHHPCLLALCHRGHHKEKRKGTGFMQKAKN